LLAIQVINFIFWFCITYYQFEFEIIKEYNQLIIILIIFQIFFLGFIAGLALVNIYFIILN